MVFVAKGCAAEPAQPRIQHDPQMRLDVHKHSLGLLSEHVCCTCRTPVHTTQGRQQLLPEEICRFIGCFRFHVTAQTWLLGWIDGLMCSPYWNDVHAGQVLPMRWLDVPMSVHPSGPCTHVSCRKGEEEERQ